MNQSDCWLQNSSVRKKLYYIHQTLLPSYWLRVWEQDQVGIHALVLAPDYSLHMFYIYIINCANPRIIGLQKICSSDLSVTPTIIHQES